MSKVIITAHVTYPRELIRTFNRQASTRQASGERGCAICFRPGEPNFTVFVLDWESFQSASSFWSSSESKEQIAEWHAVDTPEILVLEQFE